MIVEADVSAARGLTRPAIPVAWASDRILADVALVSGVPIDRIKGRASSARALAARRAWLWLLRAVTGAGYRQIGFVVGRDPKSVGDIGRVALHFADSRSILQSIFNGEAIDNVP